MACPFLMLYKCVCKDKICYFECIKQCNKKAYVSVILPTYNEEELIAKLLKKLIFYLNGKDYEIIVVDDDSNDKTPKIIDKFAKKYDIIALHRYGVKGIFSALKDGVKLSHGKVIVLMDADFSHPPEKVPELLKYIPEYDLVSGSRFIKGSKIIAPLPRKLATICLNKVLRIILRLKPKDLTGAFHAIKRDKFYQINFRYDAIWGEFDMELFYEAIKKGFKIKEIPFTYDFRKEGTSKSENLIKYGFVYLIRAIKIAFFK